MGGKNLDYFYTKDHLGSIRKVVAADGIAVKARYEYTPWGEVTKIGGTGVESDFLYTGHFYHEESDLFLTWFRAYDPGLGRWLSRDPIAENGGINLYAYVLNNPVLFWDPLGLILEFRIGPPGEDRSIGEMRGSNYQPSSATCFLSESRPLDFVQDVADGLGGSADAVYGVAEGAVGLGAAGLGFAGAALDYVSPEASSAAGYLVGSYSPGMGLYFDAAPGMFEGGVGLTESGYSRIMNNLQDFIDYMTGRDDGCQ